MKAISQALEGGVDPNQMCKLSLVGDEKAQNMQVSFLFSFFFCFYPGFLFEKVSFTFSLSLLSPFPIATRRGGYGRSPWG